MNTGGKYDTRAFKKSVGLNGVGTKAVNALSSNFIVASTRDGKTKSAEFKLGVLSDEKLDDTEEKNGTFVKFKPDQSIFKNYRYRLEYVEKMIKFYVYLNPGLTIRLNGNKFKSEFGLKDLIEDQSNVQDFLYQ